MPHLFSFGFGYCAEVLANRLLRDGWRVTGTVREPARQQALAARGFQITRFERGCPLSDADKFLADVTHVLVSIPPDETGDVVLDLHADLLAKMQDIRWIGYLSTTGVYGDTNGLAVDETAPLRPSSDRSRRRVEAERRWLELGRIRGLPVHLFRLAGIYGRGRNTLDQVRAGRARRIDLPNLFSRIHVDDVANVLMASMARPYPGAIYNVCDDVPAKPADVTAFACDLLGVTRPPLRPFDEAAKTMSQMALSFWRDNRQVSNARIKRELGVELAWPDFRAGLRGILDAERQNSAAVSDWKSH